MASSSLTGCAYSVPRWRRETEAKRRVSESVSVPVPMPARGGRARFGLGKMRESGRLPPSPLPPPPPPRPSFWLAPSGCSTTSYLFEVFPGDLGPLLEQLVVVPLRSLPALRPLVPVGLRSHGLAHDCPPAASRFSLRGTSIALPKSAALLPSRRQKPKVMSLGD